MKIDEIVHILPEKWWHHHHQDCGTEYRGCHPTKCPKEVYEQTGIWIGDKKYDHGQ